MTNLSVKPVDGFDALGDATRRSLVESLAAGPASVGQLARTVPVTRPAVSQHLKVLKDAGLVSVEAVGARRLYRLDPRGIGAMRDWLDRHWGQALDAFAAFADAQFRPKDRDPE